MNRQGLGLGRDDIRDLGAVFQPTEVVRECALAVAKRRGIAKDWLNDAVKRFLRDQTPKSSVSTRAIH